MAGVLALIGAALVLPAASAQATAVPPPGNGAPADTGSAPPSSTPPMPIPPAPPEGDAPALPAVLPEPIPPGRAATAPQTGPELLSVAWLQRVLQMIADPDITDGGLESGLEIALECAGMAPDRPAPWRLALYLADQLETSRPDLALAARRTALENLARIEPRNDSVTLARLTDAVEAHGTAEQRVRAYERLLDPANAARLGAPVRGRLAYQLAMLHNRMGNTELFARWLGEAVKIDPAFPQATMAAAGFFRTRANDPVVDVELLCTAIEANPRSLQAWSALITVLLDHAAYASAERVCRNALVVAEGDRHWASINNLTCDLAVALWGQGKRDEAQRVLTSRLRTITEDYQRALRFTDATLTPERIRAMLPPLPPGLALNGLALAQGRVTPDQLERLVEQAIVLTEAEQNLLKQEGIGRSLDALLDKATIALLFRRNPSEVQHLIEDADKAGLLSSTLRTRLQGLLDWRAGRLDAALAALGPVREGDTLAQFGYASALADAGRTGEAAREFHALAKGALGTTLGLMALDRLAVALKQDVVLTPQLDPAIAEGARALDAAVKENLSPLVDDMMRYPARMLSVTLTSLTETATPYAWLRFKVTIRNLSRMPLAIGRNDPIISRLVLRAAAPTPGEIDSPVPPPAIIPFDPALELAPGATIEYVVDATLTPLGRLLARRPLLPHVVSPSIMVNPRDTEYGSMPAFMGSVTQMVPFMANGVPVTPESVADSLRVLEQPPSATTAYRLVLLAHAAADPESMPAAAREALRAPGLWKAIADAWLRLDSTEAAWVVTVIPTPTPAMAPLMDAIRASTDPRVLTSWLLARIAEENDPMIDVAKRTGLPRLVRMADAVNWIVARRTQRSLEQLGVNRGQAGPSTGSAPAPAPAPAPSPAPAPAPAPSPAPAPPPASTPPEPAP